MKEYMFIKIKEWRLSENSGKDEYDMLIPVYIFSHEKDIVVYNIDKKRLEKMKSGYQNVVDRLD